MIATAIMVVVLLVISTMYAAGIGRLVSMQADRERDLLDTGATTIGKPDASREAATAAALAANPLNQTVLNALFVERARRGGRSMSKAEADTLLRLGWRDEVALRNVSEVYADGSNLPKLLDVFDALLRREKVGDPVINVLGIMETVPRFHAALVRKLGQNPPWRSLFLRLGAGQLTSREAVLRRLQTYQGLERTSHPADELETAAMLPVLHARGFGAEAFALEQDGRRRRHQPPFPQPLNDTSFARAAKLQENQGVATVYDWLAEYGDGIGVGFGSDPAGLSIEWNGRGVPVFVRQRTSAAPGAYRLTVDGDIEPTDRDAIGYRLVCPEGAVELVAVPSQAIIFRTAERVPCAFPTFEIFGRTKDHPHDVRVRLSRLALSSVRS